jgi:hypothetical protein
LAVVASVVLLEAVVVSSSAVQASREEHQWVPGELWVDLMVVVEMDFRLMFEEGRDSELELD